MKTRKNVAGVLSFLLLFVLLFSHLFIVAEADHQCSGEDCRICQTIWIVEGILKGISLLIGLSVTIIAMRFAAIGSHFRFIQTAFRFTPILLKVKLSN